ncbi:MAG: transposase, partial [Chloroflexota bacterium]
ASPGAYFVTMCTHQRSMLFGDIVEGGMRLNDCGKIIGQEWEMSASIRREITLDAFVVTPNHIHAVVFLEQSAVGATGRSPSGPPRHSLGAFVGGFKSATTKRINDLRRTPGQPVWQRNYYEHVIRDETSLNRIRESITGNPARWNCDRENPAATTPEAQLVWRA